MKDKSGPAFPMPLPVGGIIDRSNSGMTMRQWYKGMVLQGLLTDSGLDGYLDAYVYDAAKLADLMLKEDEEAQND